MNKADYLWLRLAITAIILVGLLYLPPPAFSQERLDVQNLIRNGGFEQGFQGEFGVGYDWGGFSNGNAVVGWSAETWDAVVAEGEQAQMIEIKDAAERDRYAGIYQTVPVVPGQQYKLTIRGLIRSTEGAVEESNFGYRLQYAIDHEGGTAWELLSQEAWQELDWDEQALYSPEDGAYEIKEFETTITARTDTLTLFIRGWKKWINDGSGIFNLDDISLSGPAPESSEAPLAQAASVGGATAPGEEEMLADSSAQLAETEQESASAAESDDIASQPEDISGGSNDILSQPEETVPSQTESQLPVSGQGRDASINYVLIASLVLLLLLLVSAMAAAIQGRRRLPE